MSIDDKHSDHDLKAYLDGRDGVSAAYHKTAHEEPPRALDQAILDAARKHVRAPADVPAKAWYAKRPPYALAASFMVAVVAVSLYFNSLDEIALPAAMEEATVRVVEFQNVERAAEAEFDAKAAEATAAEEADLLASPEFETRQLAPAAPAIGAADSVAVPAAPGADINRDAFARTAEPPPVVIDGLLLEEIEADAARVQVRRDTASTASQAPQEQGGQLQEITVTGSRIMRRDAGDVSYRESREDWLFEISEMTKEFAARSRLTTARAAAARLEQQLSEEMDLYLEAYPDADLEAELDALEE
jgi:hypothetical protein